MKQIAFSFPQFLRLFFQFLFLFSPLAYTQENVTIVAVGEAQHEKEKISILPVENTKNFSAEEKRILGDFELLLLNDFSFYQNDFTVPSYKEGELPAGNQHESPDFEFWSQKKSNYLITSKFLEKDKDLYKFQLSLYKVLTKEKIFEGLVEFKANNLRERGHKIANELYKKITGQDSIFTTQIVFVSDLGSRIPKTIKELFIMDFDGFNKRKLTNHHSIVLSPAISPDKRFIVYSLISDHNRKKNINLFLYDLEKGTNTLISAKDGINSGAIFSSDGEHVIFTLSMNSNVDIYRMNIKTKALERITKHYADDVDPSLSSDGKTMTFLSNRAGRAMIYTMDLVTENTTRISYVGKFNATPRFSPDGKEITFGSWVDNNFDIYRINSDGSGLVRLTKDFGSNENPSFSNDGKFIVFSSFRVLTKDKAAQNLYIMDRDGQILGPITQDFGNCSSPRWSN